MAFVYRSLPDQMPMPVSMCGSVFVVFFVIPILFIAEHCQNSVASFFGRIPMHN